MLKNQNFLQTLGRLIWILGFFFIGGILSGCQSFSAKAPGPIIESPLVTGGELKLGGEVGWRSAQRVVVSDNAGARPPVTDAPKLGEGDQIFAGLTLGLAKFMDAKVALGMFDTAELQIKVQPLGNGLLERKAGDFVAAGFLNFGNGGGSSKGDQAVTFGPGGFPWSASASMSSTTYGGSAGYLWSEELLTFIGYSESSYRLRWEIKHEASRDGTSPAADYSGTQTGSARAVGPGLEWLFRTGRGGLIVTYAREWRKWGGSPDLDSWRWGATLRVVF